MMTFEWNMTLAQNMAVGAEIPGNIINGLLSARKHGTKRV